MAVADASKWFTRQGGEPATAFISGSDGVAAVTQTYTDFTAADTALDTAKVNTATVGNLLTANQASIETDTTGFVGLLNVASMSASSAAALYGSKSLAVTSTGSDDTKIQVSSGLYTYDVHATAGQTYTFSVYVKSAATPRSALAVIVWRDAGGSGISTTTGTAVTTTTSGWTRVLLTGVAPAGTVHAQPVIVIVSSVADEVHYFDGFGFWQGAGGQWALPGTPITNLGFYTDESVGRRLFQWDANNSRFQQTFGDTGWRDVTSLVTPPADLTITTIYVRRINSTVYVRVKSQAAAGIAATVWSWSTIGTGFTPVDIASQLFYYYRSFTDAQRQLWYRDNITADIGTSAANPSPLDVSWIHVTSDAWPTTLPGSAVGSIPA